MQSFGTRDGLLSPKLFSLFQDKAGFLWIGSEIGFSRYDGYNFENFQYTDGNQQVGKVLCFAEDKLNGLWIGGEKGLFYLRNDSLEMVNISHPGTSVECIIADDAGNIWLGELNGLYKIDAERIPGMHLKNAALKLQPFKNFKQRIFTIASDGGSNLYAGTFDGINRIDTKNNKIEEIWQNTDTGNFIKSLQVISPGQIYFNRYDGQPELLSGNKTTEISSPIDISQVIFKDLHDVYALTTSRVVNISGNKQLTLINFQQITNNVTAAIVDRDNNIWVASWEGLLRYRQNPFTVYPTPPGKPVEIFSMFEQGNQLFFGSNRGIIYTEETGKLVPSKFPAVFNSAEVLSVYHDPSGVNWFGSGYQGLSRLRNYKVESWTESKGLADNTCDAFYRTNDGVLFACTEKGVIQIDPLSDTPIRSFYGYQVKQSRYGKLYGGFQLQNDQLLFYGASGIFNLINDELIQDSIQGFKTVQTFINKIVRDRNSNVWIATQGKGLLKCHEKNGKLVLDKQYGKTDGLSSDIILSTLVDKNNNLWIGYHGGIGLLTRNGSIINYNYRDGFLAVNYQNLELEMQSNGSLWALTSMGCLSFHPDSIQHNSTVPGIYLKNILVNNMIIADDPAVNLSSEFAYDKNSFRFEYSGISLTDATKLSYSYRLSGIDSTWTSTQNKEVDYKFLNPGEYTFQVRACVGNSSCSEPINFRFEIGYPFWQSWWFYTIMILLVTGIIYYFFRLRIRNILKQNAVKQQMAELEGKALRAQMNPHFIFNSLNAIQECIVTEKIDSAYEYLSRFSKLLRLVLNHSEKNLISLASEVETLKLYLSLESLRFKGSFSYEIKIDDNLDIDEVMVPSLLLQPYVENAIWHGLINKEGDKKLVISFAEVSNRVVCTVNDNGIGRQKAGDIKLKKIGAARFDSRGTILSMQRIKTLNQQFPGMVKLDIIDHFDDNNNPAGTSIIISLLNTLQQTNRTHDKDPDNR